METQAYERTERRIINGLEFVLRPARSKIRYDCYEIYDNNGKEVGYIKFRRGYFRCYYTLYVPWKVLYAVHPNKDKILDGTFETNEKRYYYLNKAAKIINHKIQSDRLNPLKRIIKNKKYSLEDERIIRKLKFVMCEGLITNNEEYDVYTTGGNQVGVICRFRSGSISCYYPNFFSEGCKIIYYETPNPKMESYFYNDEERYYYLNKIAKSINNALLIEKVKSVFNNMRSLCQTRH
jgi:hypothetical protein